MRRPRRATIRPVKLPKAQRRQIEEAIDPRPHLTLAERWEADGDDIFTAPPKNQEG